MYRLTAGWIERDILIQPVTLCQLRIHKKNETQVSRLNEKWVISLIFHVAKRNETTSRLGFMSDTFPCRDSACLSRHPNRLSHDLKRVTKNANYSLVDNTNFLRTMSSFVNGFWKVANQFSHSSAYLKVSLHSRIFTTHNNRHIHCDWSQKTVEFASFRFGHLTRMNRTNRQLSNCSWEGCWLR